MTYCFICITCNQHIEALPALGDRCLLAVLAIFLLIAYRRYHFFGDSKDRESNELKQINQNDCHRVSTRLAFSKLLSSAYLLPANVPRLIFFMCLRQFWDALLQHLSASLRNV